ncbi:hypothetical protein EW026_g7482, partial [Hermanssonia centrifuga]
MANIAPPTQGSTPQVMHPENHTQVDSKDTRFPKDHKYLCMETAGSFVGPVFPGEFMERFMDIPGRRKKIPRADFSNVLRGTSNADMYDSLISAIKKSKICPSMIFRKLSDITQEDFTLRPDLAGFNATDGEPSGNATCWSIIQLCIDNCTEDAFDAAYDPNDRESLRVSQEDNTKSLGQMIHYAREQMSHQHRVFMFSLHIVHDSARIIRWDRMGAIVTEAFNFVLQPQILAEFLFRFNLLGPEGRGFDSSAGLAHPKECHEFTKAVVEYLDSFGERKPPHFDLTLDASYPTYKLHIIHSGSGAIRNTLVAIQCAYQDAKLLHRDISMGNIMLDSNMNGFLNDWDRGIRLSASEEARARRTGTWRFLSIEHLESENKIHEIHDDLESCFWVFLYAALHHFRHQPVPFDMSIFEEVWDSTDSGDGTKHFFGGGCKDGTLTLGEVQRVKFDSGPLNEAIHHMSSRLEEFHGSRIGTSLPDPLGMKIRAAHATVRAKMEDPSPLIKFLDTVLDREDWPLEDDALYDPYPPKVPSPCKKEENSYSEQNSPYISRNESQSPAAIGVSTHGVSGSQPVVVEERSGRTGRDVMSSRPHSTSSKAITRNEQPPLALISRQMISNDATACESDVRVGKQRAPENIGCAADEREAKRPRTARRDPKQKNTTQIRKQLCTEMGGSFAGGMPPKKFMDTLIEVAAAPSEPKMYDPLISAINTHRLCQGVTFKDISGRAQDGTKLKPDIGGFEGNEMQLYIELKPLERQDAFHDSHNSDDRIEKQTDRGFDTTVTPADQHEIALLSSALEGHADLFGKHLPTQLEEDQAGQQRAYKISVIIANGIRTALVVGKPFCQPLSPCGRATRGYIAWDLVQEKLVFLKDTWRVVSPGSLSESEAYEHLKGHGVPHLPTVIAAADVMDLAGNPQRTLTQDFANHPCIAFINGTKLKTAGTGGSQCTC